jgi:hypothetical protein
MAYWILTNGIPLVLTGALVVSGRPGPVDASLTLRALKTSYLLGEPVVVRGILSNKSDRALSVQKADSPHPYKGVHILLSRDGKDFREYEVGLGPDSGGVQRQALPARGQLKLELRLVYTTVPTKGLAFRDPGQHFIRVDYPICDRKGGLLKVVESNVIEIQVKRPQGLDTEVWQLIQTRDMLEALQLQGNGGLLGVFKEYPQSTYRAALWHSLALHYHRGASQSEERERAELRNLLGIADFYAPPQDPRLDAAVPRDAFAEMSVGSLLALLTKETKVPFDAAEDLKDIPFKPRWPGMNLRWLLSSIRKRTEAVWVPRGNGYYLTRDEVGERERR